MAVKTGNGTATTTFAQITFKDGSPVTADSDGAWGGQLAVHNKDATVVLLVRGGTAATGGDGSEWEIPGGGKESFPIIPGCDYWVGTASGSAAWKAIGVGV